jgi:tetratricopeptide (TPR) repeat protein
MSGAKWRSKKRVAAITLAVSISALAIWLYVSRDIRNKPSGRPSHHFRTCLQAETAFENGEFETAGRLLDQVLQENREYTIALLMRGQVYRELGDQAAAAECWKRIPDRRDRSAVARHLEGSQAFEQRQLSRGEERLRRSKQLDPEYAPPREMLVGFHSMLLQPKLARRELKELRSVRKWTVSDLARYRTVTGPPEHSEQEIPRLQEFLENEPAHVQCRAALVRHLTAAGRFQQAGQVAEQAPALIKGAADLNACVCELHLARGDLAAAGQSAEVCSAGSPTLNTSRSIGLYSFANSDWQRAADNLKPSYEANPDDREVAYKLGLSLKRIGQSESGQRYLEISELLMTSNAEARRLTVVQSTRPRQAHPIVLNIARLLSNAERFHESVYWYEQALNLVPGDRSAIDEMMKTAQFARESPVANSADEHIVDANTSLQQRAAANQTSPGSEATVLHNIQLVDEHETAQLDFQYRPFRTGKKLLLESLGGAVAVMDLDADDWPDLFFPQGCPLPRDPENNVDLNQTFRNRGDGTYTDISAVSGLQDNRYGQGTAAADFNNDGFADLAVGNYGELLLYQNNGDGTFTEIGSKAGVRQEHWTSSIAWGDLNQDGNVDLYVANYLEDAEKVCRDDRGVFHTCSPENYSAQPDRLFVNHGNRKFEDVTHAAGITGKDGKGIGVIICDLDVDGRDDIYVANDGTANHLYANQTKPGAMSLEFVEIGVMTGSALKQDGAAQAGMGIACADLTGNEKPDLYVTHFRSDCNTLYRNHGALLFTDMTAPAGLVAPTLPMLGFGAQAVDFDLDGWLDLFVANGHIDDYRDEGVDWMMPAQVFRNVRGRLFVDISNSAGRFFSTKHLGRGVARLDWNRDGRPDIVMVAQDGPVQLLTNRTDTSGHFLNVSLTGTRSNRSAVGARVTVMTGERVLVRQINGGDGFFATNEPICFFGTAYDESIERLVIHWPSGLTQSWDDVDSDTSLRIVEGRGSLW